MHYFIRTIFNRFLFYTAHTKDNLDLPAQLNLSILVFWSFAIIFALCELGAQVTKQFNTLNEELGQSKWYMLTIEVQKMILIFMSDAEQPVFLQGYGNIECTRDAFKNVIGILFV